MSKTVKKKPVTKKVDKSLEKVMGDFRLFAKNFIKIVDNDGNSVPFILNPEQEYFIKNMEKFNIILKGRQIGGTTMIIAKMLHMAVIYPDTNYIIMTQHAKVTQSLLTNLKRMYHSLPHEKYPDLFPKVKMTNRDGLILFNGSSIQVATAGGEDSISGNTFRLIHFSEFAKYPENMQEEILSTAIPALAKSKSLSSICIESTAFGYNFFQELFMKAYRKNDSVWKPFFFSWLAKGYEKQFKVSFDEAETYFRLHNGGRRMSADDLEWDEIELREVHKATYRQLMFRRYYIASNSLEKWNREFPITPEIAFSETNKSVFSTAKIAERSQYLLPPMKNTEVEMELPESLRTYVNKNLFVYRLPEPKVKMYGGVDVASGSGGDFSFLQIINADGEQMMSFYSNDIPVYEFAKIVDTIGRFYNYAHLCIEKNNVGLPLIERLRKDYKYQNLYKQKIFDVKGNRVLSLGFTTTRITKPILISDMKESFELGHILIEETRTLDEMRIYVEENGKMGNIKGAKNFDDGVISMSLAVQARKNNKYYVEL